MGVSPSILPLSGGHSLPELLFEDLHTTRRGNALILGEGFALFIRHYWGHPCRFLIPPLTDMLKFSGVSHLRSDRFM